MNRFSVPSCILAGVVLVSISAAGAADWPQWRGADRVDISPERNLLQTWPSGGPQRVWLFEKAGLGYSGPSIVNGKLFTMGVRGDAEQLICLDAETGKELWSTKIGPVLKNGWGDGPRGTPTVDGDHVYALGGEGHLICAAVADGAVKWKKEMVRDFGGGVPSWGYAESVLIDGDKLICTPGGKKGAIAALDKNTGDVIWQSKDFTDGAQYSSVIIATPHEQRQYVQLVMKNLVGIDPETGDVLWQTKWNGRTAVIPTPIYHNDSVYITSGYGVGSMRVKIKPDNSLENAYENKEMKNHHGGVILVDGHLYGYSDGAGWVCQKFDTGEMVWNDKRSLGKGAIHCADGKFYLLSESDGTVVLIDISTEKFLERGRFQLDPQSEQRSRRGKVWTHPVVINGKLYLRDQEYIYCFDVKAK